MTKQPENLQKKSARKVTNKKQVLLYRLWITGAAIGFFGGTCGLIAGLFLTIYDFLQAAEPHGSRLFLAVLPLWIFGAHSLDKADDAEYKFP